MTNKKYYTDLCHSILIGYIDGYDAVHSKKIHDDDYNGQTHSDLFGPCLKGWRWDYRSGIDFSVFCGKIDRSDADLVRSHLISQYNIPFYDNGFHDVQFFCDMVDKEDNSEL